MKFKCTNHVRDVKALFKVSALLFLFHFLFLSFFHLIHLFCLFSLVQGVHLVLSARSEDDLDEDDIKKKVSKSSGSNYSYHKEQSKPEPPPAPVVSVSFHQLSFTLLPFTSTTATMTTTTEMSVTTILSSGQVHGKHYSPTFIQQQNDIQRQKYPFQPFLQNRHGCVVNKSTTEFEGQSHCVIPGACLSLQTLPNQ